MSTSEDDFDPSEHFIICYWCARKRWGFVDEFRGNAPLDDVFFEQLEKVGKVRLTRPHRDLIRRALLHYSEPGRHFGPKGNKKQQSIRRLANHIEGLLREMSSGGDAYSTWIEFHVTPPWVKQRGAEWWLQFASVLELVKEEADFSCEFSRYHQTTEKSRRHRPKNFPVIELVQQCGHVYSSAGGRVKISNNAGVYCGPYAEFLRAIWEIIPSRMRPPSPNAFPRTAIDYFTNCSAVMRTKNSSRSRKRITGTHRAR